MANVAKIMESEILCTSATLLLGVLRQRWASRLIGVFQFDQVAECHPGLIDRLDVAIGGKSVVAEDESGKVAFQGSPHTIASASISTS